VKRTSKTRPAKPLFLKGTAGSDIWGMIIVYIGNQSEILTEFGGYLAMEHNESLARNKILY
jgi:hypothetical protein